MYYALPFKIVHCLMKQIASFLHYLHFEHSKKLVEKGKGYAHRDIKLANVLISPIEVNGLPVVKVADFGITRVLNI